MDKFVIETFVEGELICDEIVESNQRLLNEQDLDVICINHNKDMVFVRDSINVNAGYFLADDGRWCYGTRVDAVNKIKMRYGYKKD